MLQSLHRLKHTHTLSEVPGAKEERSPSYNPVVLWTEQVEMWPPTGNVNFTKLGFEFRRGQCGGIRRSNRGNSVTLIRVGFSQSVTC